MKRGIVLLLLLVVCLGCFGCGAQEDDEDDRKPSQDNKQEITETVDDPSATPTGTTEPTGTPEPTGIQDPADIKDPVSTPTQAVSSGIDALKALPRVEYEFAMEFFCNRGYRYCDLRYWIMRYSDTYESWAGTTYIPVGLLGIATAEKAPDPETGEDVTACWIFFHAFPEYQKKNNSKRFSIYVTDMSNVSQRETSMGVVFFEDGLSVQEWLLSNGLAIAHPEPGSEALDAYFASLEAEARRKKVGVWRDGYETKFAALGDNSED